MGYYIKGLFLVLLLSPFTSYAIPSPPGDYPSQTTVVIKCNVPIAASISTHTNYAVGSMLQLSQDKGTIPMLAVVKAEFYIVLDCEGNYLGVTVRENP